MSITKGRNGTSRLGTRRTGLAGPVFVVFPHVLVLLDHGYILLSYPLGFFPFQTLLFFQQSTSLLLFRQFFSSTVGRSTFVVGGWLLLLRRQRRQEFHGFGALRKPVMHLGSVDYDMFWNLQDGCSCVFCAVRGCCRGCCLFKADGCQVRDDCWVDSKFGSNLFIVEFELTILWITALVRVCQIFQDNCKQLELYIGMKKETCKQKSTVEVCSK